MGMDRRRLLVEFTAAATAAACGLPSFLLARPAAAEPAAFSFDALTDRMRELAAAPHDPGKAELPEALSGLSYDQHRAIRFRPEHALWRGENSNFQVQAFHPGWLFDRPVRLFAVENGTAHELHFSSANFEYRAPLEPDRFVGLDLPGVAGFRLHYPLNRPDYHDELISFLGASYFRALARDTVYGLSARGLAINTASGRPEEFPYFTEFYIEHPPADAESITVCAALDSQSVTGAYMFAIRPGIETVIDVTARIFFRQAVETLGIAPLTGMYLFGENDDFRFDDYRPEVHDCDGLAILRRNGEQLWRPLHNPQQLALSFFVEESPAGFGLFQRDRAFASYEDPEARYERRPSVWIEPLHEWGSGGIKLVEIPSDREINDNIVAFWAPDATPQPGEMIEYVYRMRWGISPGPDDGLARAVATRTGVGGVSGEEPPENSRKFVVDFEGGVLPNLAADAEVEPMINVTNGDLLSTVLAPLDKTGRWRLTLDVQRTTSNPVELRAQLILASRVISETWLYQWNTSA